MKLTIFVVLALCFALTNAASIDPSANEGEDTIKSLEYLIEKLTEISERVKAEVRQKYDEVLVDPRERVEEIVAEIEELSKDNEKCIAQRRKNIKGVLECLDNSIGICIDSAKLQAKKPLHEIKGLVKEIIEKVRGNLPTIVNHLGKCATKSGESARTELKSIYQNVKKCTISASSD